MIYSRYFIFANCQILSNNPYDRNHWRGLNFRIMMSSRIYAKIKSSRIKSVLQYIVITLSVSLSVYPSTLCCNMITQKIVFPSNRLELSPSLEYRSRDLSIYPMLKLLYLTLFSEVFTLYSSVFSLKIQMTKCFK